MSATALTTGLNTQPSIYAATPLLNPLVYQAADASNGNSFVTNGRTLLFLRNTDSSTHTVTLVGVVDVYDATPSIGTVTIPILGTGGGEVVMGPFPINSPWATNAGVITFTCSSALVYCAALTLPG
jgi:hypothetical protein